jgi:antitoxin MazE
LCRRHRPTIDFWCAEDLLLTYFSPCVSFHSNRELTARRRRRIFIVDTTWEELAMKTRIQKWGNSLALRIPKAFATEAGLAVDVPVELSIVRGKIVVHRLSAEPPTLNELLRGISRDNLHGEWDTGPAAGKEIW